MSERPEPDKTAQPPVQPSTTTAPKPQPPEPHATTAEKPGTGTTKPDNPPQRPQTWDGSDRYPDGFVMSRNPDGTITLQAPDKTTATWDGADWFDPKTLNPMPEGWSKGHRPEIGAHPNPPAPPAGQEPTP